MRYCLMLFAFLASLACRLQMRTDPRATAASVLTQRYAHSPLAAWKVRGSTAGADCDVLLVETSVIMEDSMIEALHYGAGAYGVVDGGVQRFYRQCAFRGVAYRDSSGRLWTYGGVTQEEAERLKRCA